MKTESVRISQEVFKTQSVKHPNASQKNTSPQQEIRDRVVLSAQAREIQAAREAFIKICDVDHEKVTRIKAQIDAGTYKIDGGKIAIDMLREALTNDYVTAIADQHPAPKRNGNNTPSIHTPQYPPKPQKNLPKPQEKTDDKKFPDK